MGVKLTKQTARLHKQLSGGEKQRTPVNIKIDPKLEAKPNCCENDIGTEEYLPCNDPAVHQVRGLQGDKWRMCKRCAVETTQRYGGYILGEFKPEKKKK